MVVAVARLDRDMVRMTMTGRVIDEHGKSPPRKHHSWLARHTRMISPVPKHPGCEQRLP